MINKCVHTIPWGRNKTLDFDVRQVAGASIVSDLISSILSAESAYTDNPDLTSLATNLLTASSHNIIYLKYISPITAAALVLHGEIVITAICYKEELSNYYFRVLDAGKPFKMGIDYRLSTLQRTDMLERNICWMKHFRLSNVRIDISEDTMCYNITITGNIVSAISKNGIVLPDPNLPAASVCPTSLLHDENYEKRKMVNFFRVKDARVSKNKTIVFWEDGTKTIVGKSDEDKDVPFDIEKAVMAAYTKRALSLNSTAKTRSVYENIENVVGMINDHLDEDEAKLHKMVKKIVCPPVPDYEDDE